MPNVRIPTPLRKLTNDLEVVSAAGANVGELLDNLDKAFPGLRGLPRSLFSSETTTGMLARHIDEALAERDRLTTDVARLQRTERDLTGERQRLQRVQTEEVGCAEIAPLGAPAGHR